ncbi:MAG: polysaccharide deacetylase family protein [Terrimicrobiaceae bacterium]|nr:polysaccharide deacetylase family protein [Terrimicrobiaceae bacterium]
MPLTKRRRLFAARTVALGAAILLRGRARAFAWTVHEILRIGPTLVRNGDWYGPVATGFETQEREVWLTIDDGPEPSQTPGVLEQLERHGARASFFVVGRKVDWARALARRIVEAGHSLENHTYNHFAGAFWAAPPCAVRSEIVRCSHAIRVATGRDARWFRSPAGLTNSSVHPIAARSWLRIAGWSASGGDGLPGREPAEVAERLMARVRPGAILLLHEGRGREPVAVLEHLLPRLAESGYRCVLPGPATVV